MRITGENEGVDAQIRIFLHTRSDSRAIADQRRSCAGTHQTDTGPEIRIDFQLVAVAAVQRCHAVLTDGIGFGESGLCALNSFVIHVGDQFVGGALGFFVGFTHNHVQTNTETHCAAFRGSFGTHLLNFLFH